MTPAQPSQIGILFLGGAKRVSMARLFKAAARSLGMEAHIVSYEASLCVPIALEGTVVEGLRWSDPACVDDIYRVMLEHDCKVVVPFVDGAVAVAARVAECHPDVFAPASSPELSQKMFDKVEAAALFEQLGIPAPATYRVGPLSTPLIAKPRRGSASKGIFPIDTEEQLAHALFRAEDYLIQERVLRPVEYTVDCYVSTLSGLPLAIVPRRRLEVEGGEVTRTITVDSPALVSLSARALQTLGLRGAVTLQFIAPEDDPEGLLLMEINPRLGGGAVCAVHAGANIPAMILSEALGVQPAASDYKPGTEIFRYRAEAVFFNGHIEPVS